MKMRKIALLAIGMLFLVSCSVDSLERESIQENASLKTISSDPPKDKDWDKSEYNDNSQSGDDGN